MSKLKPFAAGLGLVSMLTFASLASAAPIYTADFEGLALGVVPAGFTDVNHSANPGQGFWGGGNANVFAAQSGSSGSYVADTFEASSGTGIVSDWLLTPMLTIGNGYTFSFYTRSSGNVDFPDRLQVRLSTSGTSTDVGTLASDVGDFGLLLLSVNSGVTPTGYPSDWMMFTATVTGLGAPTSGRFALRYFLDDASAQGEYIGVDSIVVNGVDVVPEPSTILMMALGAGLMGLGLRRRSPR